MPVILDNDDDDWETDPDYVNNMSEEQQRWGGARDTGVLDMDKFREEIKHEDTQARLKRQQEDGYNSSAGYGGKFGVLTDRQDKSAVGWEHKEKVDKHESQKDYKTGFGGKFGVQSDRVDKSAVGWEHVEKVDKHHSQKGKRISFNQINSCFVYYMLLIRLLCLVRLQRRFRGEIWCSEGQTR